MINAPSSTSRLTSLELRKHLDGGLIIGVVSKRTYRIQNGRCALSDEQIPLVEEPVLADDGKVVFTQRARFANDVRPEEHREVSVQLDVAEWR
jgi:hypothetical protein